jgi:hypothetical protein
MTVDPTPPTSPTSPVNGSVGVNSTGPSAQYQTFLDYLHNQQHPGKIYTQHPHSWSVLEVAEWLYSYDVAKHIIEVFLKEGITGRLLLYLTKEDMGSLGVRMFRERMELGILIQELKAEWGIPDGNANNPSSRGGGGHAQNVPVMAPSYGRPVVMESGKGASFSDLPPSYYNI